MLVIEVTEISIKARCPDCNAWANEHQFGGRIHHGRRCEMKHLQPDWSTLPGTKASTLEIKAASKRGEVSAWVGSEDELVHLVREGVISQDDAMNRDF